jgi:hypothetical protein
MLEQAKPHSSFGITVDDSDIVILEIIEYDVYDTHVPPTQHKVMAAIQLIKVKIKGVDHACIYSEAARENLLAAKQQRKIVVQTFFTPNPLLAHDVLLLYNVEQTLTLVLNPGATNICNDSNGLRIVCYYVVPKSKLMIRRDLDRY